MLFDWMRRNFRTLFPTALLMVSIGLLSFGSYSSRAHHPSFFSRSVLDVIGFFENTFAGAGQGARDVFQHYFWLVGVEEENRVLRAELSSCRRKNYALVEKSLENDRLRRLLNFRIQEEIENYIPAQVIGQNLSGLNRTITINKGSTDGIRPRMAVITYDSALVGQILDEPGSAIGAHTCQVLLITDRRSRVDVAVQRPESRAKGILAGRPEREEVELLYADRLSDIRSGDLLVSSGYGGIFRKGWPVGKVVEVTQVPDLFYPRVLVEPVAEFQRLEEVMVVPAEAEL
jgi:rod shape-determining protein MreC